MKTKSINYTSKKFSFAITNCSVQVIFLEGLSIAFSKISLGWGELPIILWRIQVQARTVGKKKTIKEEMKPTLKVVKSFPKYTLAFCVGMSKKMIIKIV